MYVITSKINLELNKTEYKLLNEIVETLIQNYEAGEEIELFRQKSDKVYSLANKLKNLQTQTIKIISKNKSRKNNYGLYKSIFKRIWSRNAL